MAVLGIKSLRLRLQLVQKKKVQIKTSTFLSFLMRKGDYSLTLNNLTAQLESGSLFLTLPSPRNAGTTPAKNPVAVPDVPSG